MGQCLLAMKDLGDSNKGGAVYGFVTTGDVWRMLRYDRATLQVTDKLFVVCEMKETDGFLTCGGLCVGGIEQ